MFAPKHEYKLLDIMGVVDHTYLKPYATDNQIEGLIEEADRWGTYGVCIHPLWVDMARRSIRGRGMNTKLVVVLDFPMGVLNTDQRVAVVKRMAGLVDEVDVVTQIGYVRSGLFDKVRRDIDEVVAAAHESGLVIKIIVEDAYTTRPEKMKLYEIVCRSGADFIKTNTGYAEETFTKTVGNQNTGATVENVKLMSQTADSVGSKIGIKVAGGIHTYDDLVKLVEAARRPLEPARLRVGLSGTGLIVNEMVRRGLQW